VKCWVAYQKQALLGEAPTFGAKKCKPTYAGLATILILHKHWYMLAA
jgi:hypothetical protein